MEQPQEDWLVEINNLENKIKEFNLTLNGDPIQSRLDIDATPSISARIGMVAYESKYSSANPTGTHQRSIEIAQHQLEVIVPQVNAMLEGEFKDFRLKLQEAGAPYVPNLLPAFKAN